MRTEFQTMSFNLFINNFDTLVQIAMFLDIQNFAAPSLIIITLVTRRERGERKEKINRNDYVLVLLIPLNESNVCTILPA